MSFKIAIEKEIKVFFRNAKVASYLFLLTILFSVIVSFIINYSFLTIEEATKILPAFIWFTYLILAVIGLANLHLVEEEEGAIYAIALENKDLKPVYLAKVIVVLFFLFIAEVSSFWVIIFLTSYQLLGDVSLFILILFLSAWGISALANLLVAISHNSSLGSYLLPILLLPLLLPIFFWGVEANYLAFNNRLSQDFSPIYFLCAIDIVYTVVGVFLYEKLFLP